MRHLVSGSGPITKLEDLRAPMTDVLDSLADQLAELQRYKARFGEITDITDREVEDVSGSETE